MKRPFLALLTASLLLASPILAQTGAQTLAGVEIIGSDLVVHAGDGQTLRGADLVGAVLTMAVNGGAPAMVRIDAFRADPHSQFDDVRLYDLTVQDAAGLWAPVCDVDPYGEHPAILQPAPGGTIAIWCTGGTHAKCIRMGYRPWATGPQGQPLAPYHTACSKMLRANYCGDDQATTRTGMLVDIYDRIGINQKEGGTVPGVSFEAAWTPQGAVCVAHPRVPQNMTLDRLAQTCPRLQSRLGPACSEETSLQMDTPLLFNGSRGDGLIETEQP